MVFLTAHELIQQSNLFCALPVVGVATNVHRLRFPAMYCSARVCLKCMEDAVGQQLMVYLLFLYLTGEKMKTLEV